MQPLFDGSLKVFSPEMTGQYCQAKSPFLTVTESSLIAKDDVAHLKSLTPKTEESYEVYLESPNGDCKGTLELFDRYLLIDVSLFTSGDEDFCKKFSKKWIRQTEEEIAARRCRIQ